MADTQLPLKLVEQSKTQHQIQKEIFKNRTEDYYREKSKSKLLQTTELIWTEMLVKTKNTYNKAKAEYFEKVNELTNANNLLQINTPSIDDRLHKLSKSYPQDSTCECIEANIGKIEKLRMKIAAADDAIKGENQSIEENVDESEIENEERLEKTIETIERNNSEMKKKINILNKQIFKKRDSLYNLHNPSSSFKYDNQNIDVHVDAELSHKSKKQKPIFKISASVYMENPNKYDRNMSTSYEGSSCKSYESYDSNIDRSISDPVNKIDVIESSQPDTIRIQRLFTPKFQTVTELLNNQKNKKFSFKRPSSKCKE